MSARSFAPVLPSAGLAMSISLWCTGDTRCFLAVLLIKFVIFFFGLPAVWFKCFSSGGEGWTSFPGFHLEDDQLLVAKGRTASFELGASVQNSWQDADAGGQQTDTLLAPFAGKSL